MVWNKKYIYIGIAVLVLLVVIYLLFFRTYADPNKGKTSGSLLGSGVKKNDNFPLKIGSKGLRVNAVQKMLNSQILTYNSKDSNVTKYELLKVDGDFGQKTLNALNKFLTGLNGEITESKYEYYFKSYE